jgi:dolichol-phosphate mannosyltransferase
MPDAAPELSVVVPIYGCAGTIDGLRDRLVAVLEPLVTGFEVILVDDRSPDGAWARICAVAQADARFRALRLSRNFGQHAAITAGLAYARGAWTVVMDCDLQDPPEEIPRLLEAARAGNDIVLAARRRRSDSVARRLVARAYFWTMNTFAGTSFDGEYGSFSIISAKVRNAFLSFEERDRHYLLVLFWLGFEPASIEYEQSPRAAGRSSYGPVRLLRHALDGAFFQTTALLRWIVYFGFGVATLGVLLAIFLVVARLTSSLYPGWTSIMVALLVLGGLIVASVGITGLYVGKVFEQVKQRPLYVVDEVAGEPGER